MAYKVSESREVREVRAQRGSLLTKGNAEGGWKRQQQNGMLRCACETIDRKEKHT